VLTRNHRQEALSRAYVRAIAAQAGLAVSGPENDYGIDLTLRAITMRDGRRRDIGPQLDVQLKSTARANVAGGMIGYDLDVVNYEDLRAGSELAPRILVLLVMPEDEALWLSQSPDELALRHCAYWRSLRGAPPSSSVSTVRVAIPLANVFSVSALEGIMQRLREGREP
jgi:hypothetical protein